MNGSTAPLIDLLSVPIASRPDEEATIGCPLGGSVGPVFTADVTLDPSDTDAECGLYDLANPLNLVMACTEQPAPPGSTKRTFTCSLMADQTNKYYWLKAKGNGSMYPDTVKVYVQSDPLPDDCLRMHFVREPTYSASPEGPRLTSLTFTGARPLDGAGKPRPLTLTGMVPAAFTVGGPAPASGGLKVTLGTFPPVSVPTEGLRWAHSFTEVLEGEHTLCVTAEDGSQDSWQIVVCRQLPA